ncbi:cytochrome c biogenesis protein CcsA [Paenibacillus senegalensis]|uniref:cytochrome c biogenesis protein CcsA n=1 Tax=Paenibacillus senegalensis TaxID=1465766 RepID=UPI0002886CC9|nr:cytochrome c biogenesis protein CcsA [Paenibacillus senegalensis]
MVIQSWIYDSILYLYALSLLFYFSGFVFTDQRAKRIGTGLLIFVWALQTLYGITRFSLSQGFGMEDSFFLFTWILVTVSLLLNRYATMELFMIIMNGISFIVLLLTFVIRPDWISVWKGWDIADELQFIHMSLAIASYAAFTMSAIFSGLYLFLHRQLKHKAWTRTMRRLPSLEKLEQFSTRSIIVGVPLLVLSLSLGIIWILVDGRLHLLLDAKVLNTLLVLLVYGYSLILNKVIVISAARLAKWNLFAIAVVIVNYFFTSRFSYFH